MSLKIKTIQEFEMDKFDESVNKFGDTHNVLATQTSFHRDYNAKGGQLDVFVAVIFYAPLPEQQKDLLG